MHRKLPDELLSHLPALKRYAQVLTRDGSVAEDLVQETMLRAHEHRASLRADLSVRGWLFTVLHNLFVSSIRRNRTEAAKAETLLHIAADRQPAEQEFAVYLRQIAERFEALPESQRLALHLVAVEGLSYQEAARILDIPVGTVMSRLSRARAALRQAEEPIGKGRIRIVGGSDA